MVEAVPGNAGRADYPRMLYHADGRYLVVQNAEQHQAHLEQGFSQNPHAQHQKSPIAKNPVGGDSLQDIMRAAVERVLDERGLTKEWVQAVRRGGDQVPYTAQSELPPVPLTSRRT